MQQLNDESCPFEEEVTLDNWKPSEKVRTLQKSQWRSDKNSSGGNEQPGLDELRKINMFLKQKYPDHQIMDAFGITSETLVAIKRNCYDPVEGISLDNQSKIYKEFRRIEKALDEFFEVFKFLADNCFEAKEKSKRTAFKSLLGLVKKKEKKQDEDEEE